MDLVAATNTEVLLFGTSVLGDYAYMLIQSIISNEPERIKQARDFAKRFDALYEHAGQKLNSEEMAQLNKDSIVLMLNFRKFVIDLLTVILTRESIVFFKPAILNQIILLIDHQVYLTNSFLKGKEPKLNSILQDLFWLPAFFTQCRYIADNVGNYARTQRIKGLEFAEILNEKYIFAMELQSLTVIGTADFPISRAHRREVDEILRNYAEFLVDLILLKKNNEIPGTLSLLFLDSSYRQLCLYESQLAQFSGNHKPACNPYAPRFSLL